MSAVRETRDGATPSLTRAAAFALTLLAVGLALAPRSASADELLERLRGMWTAQASEIETARIEADFLSRKAGEGVPPLTVAEVDTFLEKLVAADSPDSSRSLLKELTSTLERSFAGELHVVADGDNLKNTLFTWGEGPAETRLKWKGVVAQGVGVEQHASGGPVWLHRGAGQLLYAPRYIRTTPDPNVWTSAVAQDGSVTVTAEGRPDTVLTVDETRGFLTRFDERGQSGRFESSRQLNVSEFPGGIVFPQISASLRGRGDVVESLTVFVIRKAEFNTPVDPKEFLVGVPPKTQVFDQRLNREEPKTVLVQAAAEDVVYAADNPQLFANATLVNPEPAQRWLLLILMNVIAVLLIAGGFFVMRRRASA